MPTKTVVVFCRNQEEINEAVQNWVNVNNYKKAYTFTADKESCHYFLDEENQWSESEYTFGMKHKTVLVFQQ